MKVKVKVMVMVMGGKFLFFYFTSRICMRVFEEGGWMGMGMGIRG